MWLCLCGAACGISKKVLLFNSSCKTCELTFPSSQFLIYSRLVGVLYSFFKTVVFSVRGSCMIKVKTPLFAWYFVQVPKASKRLERLEGVFGPEKED